MDNKDKYKIYNENHMENCNVFQGDIYGASFPLPGATVNQYFEKGAKPKEEVKSGKVESKDERDSRKLQAMKEITDRFKFEDNQLGYDDLHNRITNERLRVLFRKCYGIGSHPSDKNRVIIEQLWTLLIDDRNQCNKQPGEDFYRQTVLNVIGYFMQKGILYGKKYDILLSIFSEASKSLTKNIERGIPTSFPDGSEDMIDFYINQLMKGDF